MKEVQSRAMSEFLKGENFQAFVAERRVLWLKLAYRVLENREEAEDVVQETLALLWEKRGLLEVENPGAYLARAVWLNALKRKARHKAHLALEDVAEPATPEKPGAEGKAESTEPELLEEVLKGLPESQREVVHMKYYLGLSFKEIGEVLDISLNTAGSRCRYALEALRKALGKKEDSW